MGRPKEHGEETRAGLLAAAGRILAAEGAGALSLRRIAAEVKTTTRAVYSLFGSKDGLVSAMYMQMADTLVRRHERVPRDEDPAAELLALALAYRAGALEHPTLYPLVFGNPVPGFTPREEAVAHARRGLERVLRTVERGIEEGRFPGRDPVAITHELWALVHGLASLEIKGALGPPGQAASLWRDAVAGLVGSFTHAPERFRPRARRRG